MDGIPVQIIDIQKDEETQKSTYKLKFDELHQILYEVNDLEVAVISIAGPSRQGKSFLLSYLLRYLSNPTNTNWIGADSEPLTGFKWNHGIEPETKGVWIWSKPIIVKQSDGKEKAILIMDSQGVYDEYTDLRDWSTIVGITLLTSSCFIFNVFTDIQEDILSKLETFVNYGLLAITKDEDNRHPFQNLLFLIRDWNHERDYNYGHAGGREYITQKLSIKSNQTQSSQRTRKLIGKCFEDVTCYLMPEPGDEREKTGFNGSVSQLSPKFIANVKELFLVLLNPDSLKPKVINGTTITGRALFKFFEVFIEKFNGDELPQPMDLVEAVSKATDLNLLFNLKETYVLQMNKELLSKEFVSKYELEVLHNKIFSEIYELFKTSKKSQNYDIVKQLTQMFNKEMRTVYTKIYLENEERRERTANLTIGKSISIYCESMHQFMAEHNFVKYIDFDKHSVESKMLAKKYFTDIFGDEELDSNAPYFLKIYKAIEENEYSFKSENNKRKNEAINNYSQAVDDSVAHFQKIKTLLNGNDLLTNEIFYECEQEIRKQSIKAFVKQCNGDQALAKKFQELLKFRPEVKIDAKSESYASDSGLMNEMIIKTENNLSSTLTFCEERLTETLEQFIGDEDLNQIYETIKENTIELFENECKVNYSNFLSPYNDRLEAEIDNTFSDFVKQFESKIEELERFYLTTAEDAINTCFVQTNALFDGKSLQTAEELDTFKENLISEVKKKYEKTSKYEKRNEIKDFAYERTASAADLLIIDKLIEYYGQKMTETLVRKAFFSREEIFHIHSENIEDVIQTFNAHKKTVNSQLLNELLSKLIDKLVTTYGEYYSQNEQNRENYAEEAIESSFGLYKEFMSQELKNICVECTQFDELSARAKNKALKQLVLFCGEEKELIEFYNKNLTKLIDCAENEFKSQNYIRLTEAKRKNSESVQQSLNHYSERMKSALNENLFYFKESFKEYENNVRDESNKLFAENCKYGGKAFINSFAIDLDNKIQPLKSQFEDTFSENMDTLESEMMIKISEAMAQYNGVIHLLLDSLKSEEHFRPKHEEVKANAINSFKQKCLIKDKQYRNLQVSRLEKAIDRQAMKFTKDYLK